jgi:hypothetical protein
MEMLEVRVDVINREKVKMSGVISPEGSIVDITPRYCRRGQNPEV